MSMTVLHERDPFFDPDNLRRLKTHIYRLVAYLKAKPLPDPDAETPPPKPARVWTLEDLRRSSGDRYTSTPYRYVTRKFNSKLYCVRIPAEVSPTGLAASLGAFADVDAGVSAALRFLNGGPTP